MAPQDRTRQFHLMLSEAELEQLKEVAAAYDMTASDYVRWALGWHYEYKHLAVAKKPANHLQAMGVLMKSELARWDADRVPAAAVADYKRKG